MTLHREHPDLDLRFDELDPHLVMTPLLNGDLDMAVTHGWDDLPLVVPEATQAFGLGTDKADLVVRADHPFAERGVVQVEEVVREADWISSPQGSVCHRWLTEAMRRHGIEPRLRFYAAEYSTQFELVAAGLGVALVVRLARPSLPPGLRVVQLDPAPARLIEVVVRTAGARRPAVQAGIHALQKSWSRWEQKPGVGLARPRRPRRPPPSGILPNISLHCGQTGNRWGSRLGTHTLPHSATTGVPLTMASVSLSLATKCEKRS